MVGCDKPQHSKVFSQQPSSGLAESLQAVAQLTIAQQYANPLYPNPPYPNPVYAAALNHEGAQLPVQKQLPSAQASLLTNVMRLFAHHPEPAADLPESGARD